jgi:hypothetical protein
MTRYLLLFDSYGLVFVGRPLWREGGFVFCICCWPLTAKSFSGPCPLGLETLFYCPDLRFPFSSPSTTRRVTVEVFGPASRSRILSYFLGTDHAQKTQPLYYCMAQTTLKTCQVLPTSPLHWRVDYCLVTSYKHSSYCCVILSEVFIAPLPSYTRYCILPSTFV